MVFLRTVPVLINLGYVLPDCALLLFDQLGTLQSALQRFAELRHLALIQQSLRLLQTFSGLAGLLHAVTAGAGRAAHRLGRVAHALD